MNYATSAGSASSVSWGNVSGKPSSFTPSSHNHDGTYLKYGGWWSNGSGQNVDNATDIIFAYASHGAPSNWGTLCTFSYIQGGSYNLQLHGVGCSNELWFRNRSSDCGQKGWLRVIDSGNIGSQSVNYATKSTYLYSDQSPYRVSDSAPYYAHIGYNINGVGNRWYLRMYPETPRDIAVDYAFSAGSVAWSNVTGKPSTYTPSSHSHSEYASSSHTHTFTTLSDLHTIYCAGADHNHVLYFGYGGKDYVTWQEYGEDWRFYYSTSSSERDAPASVQLGSRNWFRTAVYTDSDRRRKKNIQNIPESSLEHLFDVSDKLFKKFTWKDSGKDSYGFIAQQLEQYIPEAITTSLNNTKAVSYNVAYAKIIAALFHKIKEQDKTISKILELLNN